MTLQTDMMLYAIACILVVIGAVNLFKTLMRRSWPETVGRIQKNEVVNLTTKALYSIGPGLTSKLSSQPIDPLQSSKRLRLSYI